VEEGARAMVAFCAAPYHRSHRRKALSHRLQLAHCLFRGGFALIDLCIYICYTIGMEVIEYIVGLLRVDPIQNRFFWNKSWNEAERGSEGSEPRRGLSTGARCMKKRF